MKARQILESARDLLAAPPARSRHAALQVAMHSAYLSALHCLARSCADAIIPNDDAELEHAAWLTVYHRILRTSDERGLQNVETSSFAIGIGNFAAGFTELHQYRDVMEWEPGIQVTEEQVAAAIATAEEAMRQLNACPADQVRPFAVSVAFGKEPATDSADPA